MQSVKTINIYDENRVLQSTEVTDIILRSLSAQNTDKLWIERIVSNGVASPPEFWYDQDFSEWCCLVSGHAVLKSESEGDICLKVGDSCFLPPHFKHRVDSVSDDAIWLTVCWY
ncbi:MAG: hypothetical protein ACRC9Q_03620 [Bacteroidales bacterium]